MAEKNTILGFHYDFALLGITTFVAGLLGVPAPNGLIPQAPIHTQSLCVYGSREKVDTEINEKSSQDGPPGEQVAIQVVEQRLSNLAQGALGLVLLTGPFLRLLSFIPRGLLCCILLDQADDTIDRRTRWPLLVYGNRCSPHEWSNCQVAIPDSRCINHQAG